jgi:hypothetical protein
MGANAEDAVGPLPTAVASRARWIESSWVTQLAPFVIALVAYLAAFLVMTPDTTGDEPHYLLAGQSLVYDGDLDLLNDYSSRDRTLRVVGIFPLSPNRHAADYRDTGQLRPVRGIGMDALVAPAVGLGGITGARILMVLIAALLADQLFRLLRDLGIRRRYAFLGWGAVALCYPMLVFSSQIYPELPGALLIVVALRVVVRRASSPVALAIGSTAAALLVWLHVRFIPMSVGLMLALVIAACRAYRGPPAPRAPGTSGAIRAARAEIGRSARVLTREWRSVTAPLAVPYLADIVLLAAVSYHLYGTVHPTAPYRAFSDTTAGTGGASFLYEFAVADLLNPAHGWIPYAPVHWLGIAALGCLVVKWRWAAVGIVALAVGYEVLLSSLGPEVGWGFPARYLILVIPLIAVPIALVIQEVRAALVAFVPLFAVSLVFAIAAAEQHLHLYPASETSRLYGVRDVAGVFPITNRGLAPVTYTVSPGQFGPLTGTVRGGQVIAKPADGPGYVTFGPYEYIKRDRYVARFELAVTGASPEAPVVTVDAVSAPPPDFLAVRDVTAGELRPGRMTEVVLEFSNPNGGLIETRAFYRGTGTLRAGEVRVEPASPGTLTPPGRFPDWPKVLAWVLATVVAGWLLVGGMRRAQSGGSGASRPGAASTTN